MSDFDRIYEELKEINKTTNEIKIEQACHTKDIEYIKREINGRLDERMDNKIMKEKYKGLIGLIGGISGGIGLIATIINFFVG
jgi:hypothetical protein